VDVFETQCRPTAYKLIAYATSVKVSINKHNFITLFALKPFEVIKSQNVKNKIKKDILALPCERKK